MAETRTDPIEQIPDADLLEQESPLNPDLADPEPDPVAAASAQSADEGDLLEQHAAVPSREEDYPHLLDQSAGWS